MSRYKSVRVDGKTRPEHIVIWEKFYGVKLPEGHQIHHIDGNSKNNRIGNLLLITRQQHLELHSYQKQTGIEGVDPNDPDVIKSREQSRRYHQEHLEERRAYARDYYHAHRDHAVLTARNYKSTHEEEMKEYRKKYYDTHKEQFAERRKSYYESHRETSRIQNKKWCDDHKGIRLAQHRLYKARRTGKSPEVIAKYEAEVLKEKEKYELLRKNE